MLFHRGFVANVSWPGTGPHSTRFRTCILHDSLLVAAQMQHFDWLRKIRTQNIHIFLKLQVFLMEFWMGNTTDCLEDMYFSATVDIHRANLFIEVQLPNVRTRFCSDTSSPPLPNLYAVIRLHVYFLTPFSFSYSGLFSCTSRNLLVKKRKEKETKERWLMETKSKRGSGWSLWANSPSVAVKQPH